MMMGSKMFTDLIGTLVRMYIDWRRFPTDARSSLPVDAMHKIVLTTYNKLCKDGLNVNGPDSCRYMTCTGSTVAVHPSQALYTHIW